MPTRRVHVLTTVRLVVLVSMILVQRNGAQGADGQSGAVPPPALDARRLSRTAEAQLGVLPAQPLYWHIYEYTSRAAAEAARGDRGTAAEVFGRHWLYAIADDQWRPAGREDRAHRSPPGRHRHGLHRTLYGGAIPLGWTAALRRRFRAPSSRSRSVVRRERSAVPRDAEWSHRGERRLGRHGAGWLADGHLERRWGDSAGAGADPASQRRIVFDGGRRDAAHTGFGRQRSSKSRRSPF